MSDGSDHSDIELPLPPRRADSSSNSSSASSSPSSIATNEIPTPAEDNEHQDDFLGKSLEEIPYPAEEESEVEIPLPPVPDSSRYSPSQAAGEDDCLGISSSVESKKSGLTVLGKAQAKKRLLAFSAAKLSTSPISSTVSSTKKVTPTKASIMQQKANKQQEQLAIEAIKQEETKMKEILAMNSILNQKLMQVNAITHNIPTTPPITAVVKPTVISTSSSNIPSLLDMKLISPRPSFADKDVVPHSPEKIKKPTKVIRKSRQSSSSSRSYSRTPEKSRSPSEERHSHRKSRRSRSRSYDRDRKESKKEKKEKEKDRKDYHDKKSKRYSRSRSKERDWKKHRKSLSRSKSKERYPGRHKQSRSRSKESEPERLKDKEKDRKRAKKSRSRSKDPEKKDKDQRSTRKSSPKSKDRADSREKEHGKERASGLDRKNENEKTKSDRKKEKEREARKLEEKKQFEREKELERIRQTKMPNDWTEYRKLQYRTSDIRKVWLQLLQGDRSRSRSSSRSPSPGPPGRVSEIPNPTPLSKGSVYTLNSIQIDSISGLKIDYPSHIVKKTKTKPVITYGSTPLSYDGYYRSRDTMFRIEDNSAIVDAMTEIINAKRSSKDSALTQTREWFSANAAGFCPSVASKSVLISHLYSDDEAEDSPAPNKNTAIQLSKKNITASPPSAESPEEDNDSIDSAPSPLLKRKYTGETTLSPVRPKKRSRRSPSPKSEEEEIPLCKDKATSEVERGKGRSSTKLKKHDEKEKRSDEREKKGDPEKGKKRDERTRKQDDDKGIKHEEKLKKRDEANIRREDKEKKREEKDKKNEGKGKHTEKEGKHKRRSLTSTDKEDIPLMKEQSLKSTAKEPDSSIIKDKNKSKRKKRGEREKKSKKKHRKRHASSSSSEKLESPTESSSKSSSETSDSEVDHKRKRNKLKKKKRSKSKKDKKTKNRDKSPPSSDDEKGGRDGGGGSYSKDSAKDSKSGHERKESKSSRKDKEREYDKDRRSSNIRRRVKDGNEWEDGELVSASVHSGSEYESKVDELIHMNPPNPNPSSQIERAEIIEDQEILINKPNDSISDSEKTTHELLSVFDDDVLLQSVLQDQDISAEKLLLNISTSDTEKQELQEPPTESAVKPVVSWSDDSEEEAARRNAQISEKLSVPTTPPVDLNSEQIPPSRASTSGYETEKKSDDENTGSTSSRSSRDYDTHNRRDYYDSRERHGHVYERRGGHRGYRQSWQSRSFDHRDRRSVHQRDQRSHYYPLHRYDTKHDARDRRDFRERRLDSPNNRVRQRSLSGDLHYNERCRSGDLRKEGEYESSGPHYENLKSNSPPVQLNVADSTISDSELPLGTNSINGNAVREQSASFTGVEGVDDISSVLDADTDTYIPHSPLTLPGSETHETASYESGQKDDSEIGFTSPKRLSLDERLEMEMGLKKEQFLPVPNPNQTESRCVSTIIHHQGRLHSEIIQTANTIQVMPLEVLTAPFTIRSTPVYSHIDMYGNQIYGGIIPGQLPARVVTIKVPAIPFTVPIMDPEVLGISASNEPRNKSSKHGNHKRKRDSSKNDDKEKERLRKKKRSEAKLMKKLKRTEDEHSNEKRKLLKETEVKDEVKELSETIDKSDHGEKDASPAETLVSESQEGVSVTTDDGVDKENEVSQLDETCAPKAEEPLKKIEIKPPPDRGILVLLGFRGRGAEDRKKVKFADGIDPGNGTSSSGGEELASPPPSFGKDPIVESQLKKKLKRKKKKKKLMAEQTDHFAPPACPDVPYPFCLPGILFQVCPQYAVLYAQAMAEKGLDIVFEPTTQLPYSCAKPLIDVTQQQELTTTTSQHSAPNKDYSASAAEVNELFLANDMTNIDFSKPPPPYASVNERFDFSSDKSRNVRESPTSDQKYQHHSSRYKRRETNHYKHESFDDNYNKSPSASLKGSKIPTIVTRQPVRHRTIREPSPIHVSPQSAASSSTAYNNDSHYRNFSNTSTTIGKNIEVLVRNSDNVTNNIYPGEELSAYNYHPVSALPSAQLDNIPLPSTNYPNFPMNTPLGSFTTPVLEYTNNITIPLPADTFPVPSPLSSVRKVKKRSSNEYKNETSNNISSESGISIPLSKIISNSSIPSLSQNSPNSSNRRHQLHSQSHLSHHQTHTDTYDRHPDRKPWMPISPISYSSSSEFTSYINNKHQTIGSNPNLINVLTPEKTSFSPPKAQTVSVKPTPPSTTISTQNNIEVKTVEIKEQTIPITTLVSSFNSTEVLMNGETIPAESSTVSSRVSSV